MWTTYAQWKQLTGDYEGLEAIFAQTLKTIPSVKLWRIYLAYLVSSKMGGSEDLSQMNSVLAKAFESAVLHVGLDVDSFPIWRDYVEFIKNQVVI